MDTLICNIVSLIYINPSWICVYMQLQTFFKGAEIINIQTYKTYACF